MENSIESALLQSNNEFVQPKPAKKPRIDFDEDEIDNEAKLLTCIECPSEFNSKDILTDHIIQVHHCKVKCKLCSKDYDILALKKHYSEDHLSNTFACDKCDKAFVTEDVLKTHQTEKHELFCVCGICKQGFQSMKELGKHFEEHELQPNSLEKIHSKHLEKKPETTKKTIAKETIQRKKTTKIIPKKYTCGLCDKSFENIFLRSDHIAFTHEKGHKCDICDKVFIEAFALQVHLKAGTYREDNECDFCNRRFVSSCGKTAHMKKCPLKLTNIVTFICNICNKGFVSSKGEVANHEKLCKAKCSKGGKF